MNDSNFLKELGRSYIVSAYLPASIFVLLGYFLFRGFLPDVLISPLSAGTILENFEWIILFLISLWVAFYLFSANDFTVRLFEGYMLPSWLKAKMTEGRKKKVTEILIKVNELQALDRKLSYQRATIGYVEDADHEKYAELFLTLRTELARLGIQSPLSVNNILPTRLGNVLRASETYAYERYRIEEIMIWPRLFNVLPIEFVRTLEEKHNHLMFLINSAFLAYLNASISLFFSLIGLAALFSPNLVKIYTPNLMGFLYIEYDFVGSLVYFLISLALFAFGYILYNIAVNAARDLGMHICASFDLYRVNLLKQMNWLPPKTIRAERRLWEDFSRFLGSGTKLASIEFPEFQYDPPKGGTRRQRTYHIELDEEAAIEVKE